MTRDEAVSKIGAAAAAVMVEAVANGGSGAGAAEIGSVDRERRKRRMLLGTRRCREWHRATGSRREAGSKIALARGWGEDSLWEGGRG